MPNLKHESLLWKKGFRSIVGIDEVGRGSWAGPMVAAGVILPTNFQIPKGFQDSKKLTAGKREYFDQIIKEKAIAYKISKIGSIQIGKNGLTAATQLVFNSIVKTLIPKPDYLLIDAFSLTTKDHFEQKAIIKGDTISASIAAASIVAKVFRDKFMGKLSEKYPGYGFEKHKGYGTKMHMKAIQNNGFTDIHRTNYNLKFLSS